MVKVQKRVANQDVTATKVDGPSSPRDLPLVIIRPSQGWVPLGFHELWEYRELLYFFAWRDIKVRYKQTVLGAAWAVIQPFFTMVVFSIFFGSLAKVPSDGLPYPIFAYCGLLPWHFFSAALTNASTSLVVNEKVITKVYFPRVIVPMSVVLSGLLDFVIAFVVLIAMMLFYNIFPSQAILTLPLFLLLAVLTALGFGLWLAALDVQYRDVRYTIAFLTQFWLFISPVAYPSSMVPERWRLIYGLNPMAGVVEGFRWALLGKSEAPGPLLIISGMIVIVVFISGLFFFRRMEKTFADVV
jgi:lipopolysaccharide transport system permease protein